MDELTPRQIREQAAYEAEKAVVDDFVSKGKGFNRPRMSIRDYLRKKAGWPVLRGTHGTH